MYNPGDQAVSTVRNICSNRILAGFILKIKLLVKSYEIYTCRGYKLAHLVRA